MSNFTRKTGRRVDLASRKAAKKAHRQHLATALRSGVERKAAEMVAAMRASVVAQSLARAMRTRMDMTAEHRKKLAEVKKIRDALVLDWRQASPAAGPCGECGADAERRWNGVGKLPDGELMEAKMVCPKCAAQIEQMAQEEGANAGTV